MTFEKSHDQGKLNVITTPSIERAPSQWCVDENTLRNEYSKTQIQYFCHPTCISTLTMVAESILINNTRCKLLLFSLLYSIFTNFIYKT